jgi:hypothetical protein
LILIEGTLPKTTINEEKDEWKTYDVKSRNIIMYLVRDHLLPCISTLKKTYLMYDVLKNIFERNNTNTALTLKHQLQNLKMMKDDTIATFFMNISDIKDKLHDIGEIIIDRDILMITLNALSIHCEPFIQIISGRVDLPQFGHLWAYCTQEETRIIAKGVQDSHHDENQSLSSHEKRGRRKIRSFIKAFNNKKNFNSLRS